MSIPVTCTCGKKLKAKEDAAGKRAKCPGCGSLISIPARAVEKIVWGINTSEAVLAQGPIEPKQPDLTALHKSWSPRKSAWLVGLTVFMISSVAILVSRRALSRIAAVAGESKPNTLETVSLADRGDPRLRALYTKVCSVYSDSPEGIDRLLRKLLDEAEKAGLRLTPEQALEGSLRWPMPGYLIRSRQRKFAEYFTTYLTLRSQSKESHSKTIRSLHGLASLVHLKSKGPMFAGFDDAYPQATPGCQMAMIESHEPIGKDDPVAEYYQTLCDEIALLYGLTSSEVANTANHFIVEAFGSDEVIRPADLMEVAKRSKILAKFRSAGKQPPDLKWILAAYYVWVVEEKKEHAEVFAAFCDEAESDD